MAEASVARRLLCELASVIRQTAPVITGIGAIVVPIWFFAHDAFTAWIDLPEKVARIEARLGEVPQVPFVEFEGAPVMWPDAVTPGQNVRVIYFLRRNRSCDTTVERRFQSVDAASVDPVLTTREPAAVAPLTLGFEVFPVRFRIPEDIGPGIYAYRPVLYCTGESPVTPPPTYFEVIG